MKRINYKFIFYTHPKRTNMPKIKITTSKGIKKTINVVDVETYLDELSINIISINVSNCNLTSISNLSRFTNLRRLECSKNNLTSLYLPLSSESLYFIDCSNNQLTALPKLPVNLEMLNCRNNRLMFLPELPKGLTGLCCDNNILSYLPKLSESLICLMCNNNELTNLPKLPTTLDELYCSNNQLTSLPELPEFLDVLVCHSNPIYLSNPIFDILASLYVDGEIITIHNAINALNRFKYLYYCLKFKLKFIQWSLRTKEAKIMEQNHPDKIIKLLESGKDVLELEKYL